MENENMNVQNSNEQNTNLNATNNGCNCGNGGMKALLIILTVAVLGLGSYFVYDKVIKKEEQPKVEDKTNSNTGKTEEKITMNVELKNNRLYVNGNMVDFYSKSELKSNYDDENSFYNPGNDKCNSDPFWVEYKVGNGFVYAKVSPCNALGFESFLINSEGQIIKKVNGKNADITLSFDHPWFSVDLVDGNSIYFNITEYTQDPTYTCCDKISKNEEKNTFVYTDKVTYLGNNEFNIEKGIKKISYEEYAKQNNINCDLNDTNTISLKVIDPSDECKVCLLSKYVSNVTLSNDGIVVMNMKNSERKTIGEKVKDVELKSYGNGGLQAIIMLQQDGTITAVDANDSKNIRILKNFGKINNITKIENLKAYDKDGIETDLYNAINKEFRSVISSD